MIEDVDNLTVIKCKTLPVCAEYQFDFLQPFSIIIAVIMHADGR